MALFLKLKQSKFNVAHQIHGFLNKANVIPLDYKFHFTQMSNFTISEVYLNIAVAKPFPIRILFLLLGRVKPKLVIQLKLVAKQIICKM